MAFNIILQQTEEWVAKSHIMQQNLTGFGNMQENVFVNAIKLRERMPTPKHK